MVSHQLAGGLEDVSIQVRVLALAATEKKLDLTKIVEYVKAQETGTRSSKLIGSKYYYCSKSGHGYRPDIEIKKSVSEHRIKSF